MKKFRILALTLFLTTGFLFPSCDDDDDLQNSCDGIDFTQFQYFDIVGINIRDYNNLISHQKILTFDTVEFSALDKIYVDYMVDYTASISPRKNWSFSLMPTANACSFIGGTKGSKEESLVNFSIITLNDFDDDHLANSNINDLFDYHGSFVNLIDNPIPFSQFLDDLTGNLQKEDMILKLMKAPEINQEFKIKVMMELSTGEMYEFEKEPIFITP